MRAEVSCFSTRAGDASRTQVASKHVESPFLRNLPYLDGESHPGNRGCSQLHMSPVRIMPKGKSKVTAGDSSAKLGE